MSDPIGNIIWGEDYFSNPHDDEIIKLIRQQIGREINKVAVRRGHFLAVREVCQLEEE